jgi:hypothetical protein
MIRPEAVPSVRLSTPTATPRHRILAMDDVERVIVRTGIPLRKWSVRCHLVLLR